MTSTYAHERRKVGASVSVQAIRWAREQRTGAPATKAVLLVLADHADKTGLAWPSTRTIADEVECDQRTARRHLERLRTLGLVEWTPGAGRGSNRYQLAIDAPRSEAVGSRTTAPSSEAPKRRTSGDHSEASGIRSEASEPRSEAPRASDQQQREQNANAEPKNIEAAAPPPPARRRARGGGRTRETATPAELNATAHRPDAYRLVGAWLALNPGVIGPQRRRLSKAVSTLLDQGADPALIPAALDEAHGNPQWKVPDRALPMAYEAARRRAARADQPAVGDPASATDQFAQAFLGRSITSPGPDSGPRAIGGTR